MRRCHHPTSRDLWAAARPASSEPRGHRPRMHRIGFSLNSPPAVRHHRLPAKLLPARLRATPSISASSIFWLPTLLITSPVGLYTPEAPETLRPLKVWPTHGWRQSCPSRCMGGVWRGSLHPFSIGSSCCHTCKG